ncbi:hypothetical protein Tco_0442651, partial [Tanacetum coccineum]
KKRKGKSKSTNGGQFTGPSVKHNVRYEPKATTSAPKKGTTYVGYTSQSTPMLKTTGNSSKKYNLSMSNSFSALNEEEEDEEEEEVENVYDESANLIQYTKAGGSSSFMAAAANLLQEMDDPEITMEEYILLETEKALRKEFPSIVYNNAVTSELELSCEPTVSPQHIDKVNWKIEISLPNSDNENYTAIYDNNSFYYKIFNVDDLKLDMGK